MKTNRIECLDGWRGLAVLLVLTGHFTSFSWLGTFGVELFFVLSGRLMASLLVDQRQPIRTFAVRRLLRVLPALLAFVATMLIMGIMANVSTTELSKSAISSILFYSNYLVGSDLLTVFQHTWSLAVEEHSYLVLIAVVVIAQSDRKKCSVIAFNLALAMMAIAAIRALSEDAGWQLYLRSESRGASIIASFALAVIAQKSAAKIPFQALPWISPATLTLAVALGALNVSPTIFCTVGTVLLSLGVNFLEFADGNMGRLLRCPLLRWFGLISFSLYLWQQPLYAAHITGLSSIVAIPLALLLGTASFYFVEKPTRRMLKERSDLNRAVIALG